MAKAIGPSFVAECKAAGVSFDGWTWSTDGSFNFGSLPQAVQDQILAVYAAHDPLTPEPDSEKNGKVDAFLDSEGGKLLVALVIVLRQEINTLRQNPTATLAAYSLADWRDKIKAAFRALPILIAFLLPAVAWSHTGTLDAYGCHSNKALFGTTAKRECHKDLLAGQTFSSLTAELKAYIAAQKAVIVAKDAEIGTLKAEIARLQTPITVGLSTVGTSFECGTGKTATLTATVTGAVSAVEFWREDGMAPMETRTAAPYAMDWQLNCLWTQPGSVKLYAVAKSAVGDVRSAVVTIEITAPTVGPPVVSLSSGSFSWTHDGNAGGFYAKCGRTAGGPYTEKVYQVADPTARTLAVSLVISGSNIGGVWFCVMTAYEGAVESAASNEVTFQLTASTGEERIILTVEDHAGRLWQRRDTAEGALVYRQMPGETIWTAVACYSLDEITAASGVVQQLGLGEEGRWLSPCRPGSSPDKLVRWRFCAFLPHGWTTRGIRQHIDDCQRIMESHCRDLPGSPACGEGV